MVDFGAGVDIMKPQKRRFVSRFSPNRTNPSDLEAIFVQRQQLAENWLEKLRDSVLTPTKHYLLAVGPRGSGKSHLASILIHRLKQDVAVAQKAWIARLPEDEVTPSFWKLLQRIMRSLNAEYGEAFPLPERSLLENQDDVKRAAALTNDLLTKLAGKPLVLVIENLDEVMESLKDEGQKRWRSFLQQHPVTTILATAQQLSDDLAERDKPFFNFFQVDRLQPLNAAEAIELLSNIAKLNDDTELSEYLQTPTGRARVRAILHMTGGSHRVFIILSEFTTRDSLDDLVSAFEELVDELTPYYQERLRWLPDQQREIVEFLCRQKRTVPVKEIASELYLAEQTASSQLKSLKEKGYVTSLSVGRESRYELTEPMMRICVEVKDTQAEPISLIVQFLRIWYDRRETEAKLASLSKDEIRQREYLEAALVECVKSEAHPREQGLLEELQIARAQKDNIAIKNIFHEIWDVKEYSPNVKSVSLEFVNCVNKYEEICIAQEIENLFLSNPFIFLASYMIQRLKEFNSNENIKSTLLLYESSCSELVTRMPDLAFSVRLFLTGLKYVRTQDVRILYDLVSEERAILYDLFELPSETSR
jgi:DNA-binding MarR family transcriptional regulator